MPSPEPSGNYDGMILDATALIDFVYLEEWGWLKQHYASLYIAQEVLDSDHLESTTRAAAAKHLTPMVLDTEAMFQSLIDFLREAPLLSIADRSTLAIAQHRFLLCASDDSLVVKTCEKHSIPYIRTLRLLTEMVNTQYKNVSEVKAMAQMLIETRGKHISKQVINDWYQNLEAI